MKRSIQSFVGLVILIFFLQENINAQSKVGIGTTTPAELLDVNGNVNVNGQLKLNGNGGTEGDVLSVGSGGNPIWAEAQQFTRFMGHYVSNTVVQIPANAKKFMVEVWGAGGGGAQGGGGASGTYVMGVYSNTVLTTLNITIGLPGDGAETYAGAAGAGGFSEVTGTGIQARATGGNGANAFFGGLLPNNGVVAGIVSGTNLIKSLRVNGENGQPTTQTTFQVASTTWHTAVQFGRGGHGVNGIGQGGAGTFRIHISTVAGDGSSQKLYQGGYAGIASGGGGGQRLGAGWGWDGGSGYVIIRY